ncbi:GNAT family N-acetyltransferase [Agrobacterium vitis]|nr:GNAT family N-acetyltransferase [Agrobacterium vitis]
MELTFRLESACDVQRIDRITQEAFKSNRYSSGTEAAIINALRAADALSISLVAVADRDVVGHLAFSSVTIDGVHSGWFGLGPVSVLPDRQGQGIGSGLIENGLSRLKRWGAKGCVVLGAPSLYRRFGFEHYKALVLPGAAPEHFLALSLDGSVTSGIVAYHEGFSASS